MSVLQDLLNMLPKTNVPVAEDMDRDEMTRGMDGIRAIVEDALADLKDKLGEGGALETMMDKAGVTDMDTVKDQDGKTILERLFMRLEQFEDEVKDLMDEVDIMMTSATDTPPPSDDVDDAK